MQLEILEPGFMTSVQDAGRRGFQRFGVPVCGAMDRFALAAANRLSGNQMGMACLEIGLQGAALTPDQDCLVGLTGCGFGLLVDGRKMPSWTAVFVRGGSVISLVKEDGGCWAYMGISGGVIGKEELGSLSTYSRAGFGRFLQAGDRLDCGLSGQGTCGLAGRYLPAEKRPQYCETPILEVIAGPQEERFSEAGNRTFYEGEYGISINSDRMGYRLEGPPVEHSGSADILSEGMVFGSIQVPADGQPIVMMSECPATGGYSKIATVCSADLPLLAQCAPGQGRVLFRQTTVEAAQKRFRMMMEGLDNGIIEPEEEY